MPHFLFKGVGFWWFRINAPSFVFSIDLFWKNMFIKLKGAHIFISHVFV